MPMTRNANYNPVDFVQINIDPVRQKNLIDWLRHVDCQPFQKQWAAAGGLRIDSASSDASFRQYYRVSAAEDSSWIIMDAPIKHEATAPFVHVAKLLRDAGVASPDIYAWNESLGFILMEDFGRTTYLNVRQRHPSFRGHVESHTRSITELYQQAIDALIKLQLHGRAQTLPVYDIHLLLAELELFRRWLLLRHLGRSWSMLDERCWRKTCTILIEDACSQTQVFVHRDYHSRNLMLVDARGSSPYPGVLDFQDAVKGPIYYDLVSLLKDCYAEFDATSFDHLLDYYFSGLANSSLNVAHDDQQRQLFDSMGIQRHLKAAGIFARLWHRDQKPGYLSDIPRTLNYIVQAGQNSNRFAWLTDLVRYRLQPCLSRQEHIGEHA